MSLQSNTVILARFYAALVGLQRSDTQCSFSLRSGYDSSPLPTVNRLWVSIRFDIHQLTGQYKASAVLTVYDPGAGPDGTDAPYLEIHAFDHPDLPGLSYIQSYLSDKVPGRASEKIKECEVIITCLREFKQKTDLMQKLAECISRKFQLARI